MDLLNRLSELLEAPPDAPTVLAHIGELAVPEMAELCFADLLGDDGRLSCATVAAADPAAARALLDARARTPIDLVGDNPVAVAVRTHRPALLRELTDDVLARFATSQDQLATLRRLAPRSAIVAPLVVRGHILGALSFLHSSAGRYDAEDLEVAVLVARRTALTLDNTRLIAELVRTESQLEAILRNLAAIVTVQDMEGLVYANQAAADFFGAATPEELLATPSEELEGRFVMLDEAGEPVDPERYPGRRALAGEQPEPMIVRNIVVATGEERWLVAKATPVSDEQGVIVRAVNVLEDVTQLRRAERQERFLSVASKLLSSSLDVEATLEKTAWSVVPELADWCRVDLPDERGAPRQAGLAATNERLRQLVDQLRRRYPVGGASLMSRVMRSGESLHFPDVDDAMMRQVSADESQLELLRRIGTRSTVIVPMTAGDRVIGSITIATTDSSARRLDDDAVVLLEELGRRAGIAVENARVHAARTHIATTLQRSLLPPRLPTVPGLTIAARFRAAGESSEVGGDFYDVFEAAGGWMVVIGDVTGKGPDAAVITSLARYTMRTAAMYEWSPAAVLGRLNDALGDDPERWLCTAVCARVEDDGGAIRVTVASGGHPPPMLLRPGLPVEPVTRPGPLLGAFAEARWEESVAALDAGESLVLYTDGVTDTLGEAERFGHARLEALLSELASCEADEIASRIDEELLAFQDGPQRDDVALLVLTATGGEGNVRSLRDDRVAQV